MKEEWNKARNDTGNIDLVLDLVKRGMTDLVRGRRNMGYPFGLSGKQRRESLRGESKIEAKLLSSPKSPKKCVLVKDSRMIKEIEFKANAAGLGNRRKGNIITDLFGIDGIGSPVAGEVKVTDRNPWYAVVECVAQVALLRADRQHLMSWLKEKLGDDIRGRGAWGIVIAPKEYWEKKEKEVAKRLVEKLHDKTKIRISCVYYNELTSFNSDKILLSIIFGKPPSTRYVK